MCLFRDSISFVVGLYFKGESEGISAHKAMPGHLLNTQLVGRHFCPVCEFTVTHVSGTFSEPHVTLIMDRPTGWYKSIGKFLPVGSAKETGEVYTRKTPD